MQTRSGLVRRVVVAGAMVASLLFLPGAALAADTVASAPEQAVVLDREMTGHLDTGGHFAYYKFAYPGGIVVSIDMQVTPDDPAVLTNVGFRVYGPEEGMVYLESKARPGLAPNVSGNLVSADPGIYLVQVYNAHATVPVDFKIRAAGVPAELAPAATIASVPLPGLGGVGVVTAPKGAPAAPAQPATTQTASSEQAVPLNGLMSGRLAAGTGGHFAYYAIEYTGGTVTTINIHAVPDDPAVLRNVGFNVYGPLPGKVYLRSGAQPGLIPNLSGDLQSTDPGTYLIQVYNYHPTASVSFDLWATGVPARNAEQTAGATSG